MELKSYQQQVLNDLSLFLEQLQEDKHTADAFYNYWSNHPRLPVMPMLGEAIEPYKNNIPRVPHVCIKVPTAGGKTYLACNALKPVFDAFDQDRPKAVVWLVPSITILDQTLKNLKDPHHPYRQRINAHFGNRVEVYDKATLLQGGSFNATSVKEQLSIMVLSFDSLRTRKKEDRKVFEENGNLQSFEHELKDDELTLGAVIDWLNPVVVVDESHNAESDLSVEMLRKINPSFILDLTATPRNNSNIISFVDAMKLKAEHMVKLPVIVYNHQDKTEVINSALQLQKRLETQAKKEQEKGGKYIRPIILFQAQPRNLADNTTFEKLKEKLIELKIPEGWIKIKTANINELKGIDLMSEDCEVRCIITVNALKEGWDCPFAYILASLADKSSAVDVEQILGRVLRQPYVMPHKFALLNVSFVLTASSRFMETLQNIVKGLNRAGFSERDYRVAGDTEEQTPKIVDPLDQLVMTYETSEPVEPKTPEEDIANDIDASRITNPETELPEDETLPASIIEIEQNALAQNEAFEQAARDADKRADLQIPTELKDSVKTFAVKDVFRDQVADLRLPQFYLKVAENDLFGIKEEVLLEKENLLQDFKLSRQGININFDDDGATLYKVDLDETKKDHTPTFFKLDGRVKESVLQYILDPSKKGSRAKMVARRVIKLMGNLQPIPEQEIEKYVMRIVDDFDDNRYQNFYDNEYTYALKIKKSIMGHSEKYAEQRFRDMLDLDQVVIKPSFVFPEFIAPGQTSKSIAKSLYEKEGKVNEFEERVINDIANLENIAFWTRNIEKKGFKINGFINHYPDFIIQTKRGKTIVLETKGDHLDAEEKIRLGQSWEAKAGNEFKYFMVYKDRKVDGAYTMEKFLELMRAM